MPCNRHQQQQAGVVPLVTTLSLMMYLQDALERGLFGGSESGSGQSWNAPECAVLLSGLAGEVKSAISRRLTIHGVARERMLFADL